MRSSYLFTSESVSEGHPDKVADQISDSIVDLFLSKDPYARVACETLVTTDTVVIAGETRGPDSITKDDIEAVARKAIREIGYEQEGFNWKTVNVQVKLHKQSADIAQGASLRAYRFDRYKTKRKEGEEPPAATQLTIAVSNTAAANKAWATRQGLSEGVILARDLINEPANVLYPVEFARRTTALKKLGVSVEVLDVAAMKKLGMGSLLAVGQGSVHESRLVVMRWNGGKKGDDPVAFIGKGVCFDTGGISIKPAAGMEDMKGDMGGAACVVGLMPLP